MAVADIIFDGVQSASSMSPSLDQVQAMIRNQTIQNNSWSAEQAQKQMDFQERMSNTAHQREVADLKAAGLNPVLSSGGNGAVVTSGAMADSDQSGNNALVAYLGKMIDSLTSMEIQRNNAQNQIAVADMYNAASRYVAEISAAAGIQQAGIHSGATMYAANQSRAASEYATDWSYINSEAQRRWNESHPQSLAQLAGSVINAAAQGLGYGSSSDMVSQAVKGIASNLSDGLGSAVRNFFSKKGKF